MPKNKRTSQPNRDASGKDINPIEPQKVQLPADPNEEKKQRRSKNLKQEEQHRWPKQL